MVSRYMDFMKRQSEAYIPVNEHNFLMCSYASSAEDRMPHLALISEPIDVDEPVLVRIHSECITGDLFGSKRCDCGQQLEHSLAMIGKQKGVLIYLRQEGRGIGIINKLKAYQLQDTGLNTADANLHLGLEVDARAYDIAIKILEELGIRKINLLTNSPAKIAAIEESEIVIHKRIPIEFEALPENAKYLETKKNLMGHFLSK